MHLVFFLGEMRTVLFFLPLCLACAEGQGLEEGDKCCLPTGGEGTCTDIQNCPYAKGLLRDGQNPGICGFVGNNPLVCCVAVSSAITKGPGALSAEKCKEYYPYKRYFILLPGAKPSLAKEFPHMAAIGYGDRNSVQWLCGGSLISHNFILTAAHCLKSAEFGDARFVRLGDLDLANDTDEAEPQNFNVKNIFPHPEYKRPSRYHDIGLIQLDRNVKLTAFVAIACLDTHREHNETQMIVTGWGRTEFLGTYSSHLLKADFNVVQNDVCKLAYDKIEPSILQFGIVDDIQLCAGGTKEQDTCQGDSGGPLQVIDQDRSSSIKVYDVVGITSFGKACGLSVAPGVYTRVYNYLSWIESIVWPS